MMYLQRHGESETNVSGLFTCRRLDPNLTATGRQQIERLIPFYRLAGVHQIITSPSIRAVQSAEILGEGLGIPVTVDEVLLEVDLGDLEGQSQRDPACLGLFFSILSDWLKRGKNTRFPGGESREAVERRLQRVSSLGAPSTLLLGHATLFTVLLGTKGMQFDRVEDLFLPHAGTARYSATTQAWEIIKDAEPTVPPDRGPLTVLSERAKTRLGGSR